MSKNATQSQLVETIFSLSRYMKDTMSFSSELTTLSLLQLQALSFLKKNKNAQMSDIAEQFKVEMPTATSLINKLCKARLTKRITDSKDRRLVRVVLTPKGIELLNKAMHDRNKKIETILSYLSVTDKKELFRIISVIVKKIEAQDEK